MEKIRPTDAAKEAFRAHVPDAAGVAVRAMFGSLGAFVNGTMFMALHGDRVAFKLAEPDRARAFEDADAEAFDPGGRTMREYVAFPLGHPGLDSWAEISVRYAATLPPKQK